MNVLLILTIIQAALQGLASLKGPVGADSAIANSFLTIIQNAMQVYEQSAGQPLDLTKIPIEAKVP